MNILQSNRFSRLSVSLFLGLLLTSLGIFTLHGPPHSARAAGPICTVNSVGGEFTSIQAAINDVGCTTINVTTVGTHNESLNIARSLILNGVGKTSTVIDRGGQSRVITVTGAIEVYINNLRITGGNADINSPSDRNGGGILVTGGATLHGENLQIDNNIASNSSGTGFGGGLAIVSNSAAYLTGTMIVSNTAHIPTTNAMGQGGGIYVNTGILSVSSSQIMSNSANTDDIGEGLGGGLFANANSQITLNDNIWQGNVAHNNTSGDVEGSGGAIAVEFPTGSTVLTITNEIFAGNSANTSNSALSNSNANGGAIYLNTTNTGGVIVATLNRITMTQNIAKAGSSGTGDGRGGVLFARHTLLTVQRANIYNNQSAISGEGSGGGIYIRESSGNSALVNSILADNTALGVGGNGAQLYINLTGSVGLNDVAALGHLTVADNGSTPNLKQGIWYDGDSGNQLIVGNTIVTSHTIGIINSNGNPSEVTIDYILFYGNTTDRPASVPDPTNKVTQNPRFVDPTNYNYHLRSDSPAIDAGLNGLTIDIDGDTRPEDGDKDNTSTVDIGADEFVFTEVYLPIVIKDN